MTECVVHPFSSRGCEYGTKGCEVRHIKREEIMSANEKLKLQEGGLYELFEKIVTEDNETAVGGKESRRRHGVLSLTKRVSSNEYVDERTQAYFQGFLLGIALATEGVVTAEVLKALGDTA